VAGDSGNDEGMLSVNALGVVVGNYCPELEKLRKLPRVYFAQAHHAAGIIEGIRYYNFLDKITIPNDGMLEPDKAEANGGGGADGAGRDAIGPCLKSTWHTRPGGRSTASVRGSIGGSRRTCAFAGLGRSGGSRRSRRGWPSTGRGSSGCCTACTAHHYDFFYYLEASR
jgi:hypothetical protein